VLGITLGFFPLAAFLFRAPRFLGAFLKTAVYFFFFDFIHELTSLELGHWTFPGENFIGWISVFGYRFPFEEMIFWMMMSPLSILSYYVFLTRNSSKN
jgi:hypothetical protein